MLKILLSIVAVSCVYCGLDATLNYHFVTALMGFGLGLAIILIVTKLLK